MRATISFPTAQTATICVIAGGHIRSKGSLALFGALVAGIGMLATGIFWVQASALGLLALVAFAWRELGDVSRQVDNQIELNREKATVARTRSGKPQMQSVGSFVELRLYEVNPPGRGNRNIFSLQLVCKAGVVKLFGLHSKEEISGHAQLLAEWLSIPIRNGGRLSLASWASQRTIL